MTAMRVVTRWQGAIMTVLLARPKAAAVVTAAAERIHGCTNVRPFPTEKNVFLRFPDIAPLL